MGGCSFKASGCWSEEVTMETTIQHGGNSYFPHLHSGGDEDGGVRRMSWRETRHHALNTTCVYVVTLRPRLAGFHLQEPAARGQFFTCGSRPVNVMRFRLATTRRPNSSTCFKLWPVSVFHCGGSSAEQDDLSSWICLLPPGVLAFEASNSWICLSQRPEACSVKSKHAGQFPHSLTERKTKLFTIRSTEEQEKGQRVGSCDL